MLKQKSFNPFILCYILCHQYAYLAKFSNFDSNDVQQRFDVFLVLIWPHHEIEFS